MDDDAPASPSTTTTGALDTASVSSNESRESWPDVPLEPSDADFSGDVFVRRDNKRLGWRRCVGSLARDKRRRPDYVLRSLHPPAELVPAASASDLLAP